MTTFLGIPVDGDIISAETRAEQRPLGELQPIIQALLDDPEIVSFGWRQYTPYFNDGDPCVFTTYGTWVRTTADKVAEDDDEDSLNVDYSHPTIGKRPRHWDRATSDYVYGKYEGPDEARYDRCMALNVAIDGGHFDDVLLNAFGDHARVKVTRDGITVDFYEHD